MPCHLQSRLWIKCQAITSMRKMQSWQISLGQFPLCYLTWKQYTEMEINRKKCFLRVLYDVLRLNGIGFWGIVLVVTVIVLFLYLQYGYIINTASFYEKVTDVVPDLLGFVMSGYAILYGVQGIILKRLNEKADDGMHPFHVISASFALTCLSLLVTLIMSLLPSFVSFSNLHCDCGSLYFFITLFSAIVSTFSLFNTILHLFSMRTQICPISMT